VNVKPEVKLGWNMLEEGKQSRVGSRCKVGN
jgi:hypothetical protein